MSYPLLEFRHVGGRQLFALSLLEPLAGPLRLGRPRAIRTEIPSRLKRTAAVRTPAAQPAAALRARREVDAHRRAAPRAQRAHLAHFGDDAQQFLRGRLAALDLREPILAEADHAARERRVAQRIFRPARGNQAAELVGDAHHLVEADAAPIAGVVALVAAGRLVEGHGSRVGLRDVQRAQHVGFGRVLPPAAHAQPPHETLRHHANQRRAGDERLDADVGQTRHRGRRVFGVQRREHEVACLRRLHRNLGCLLVADFADEDDVGVLPQNRPERAGKRQLDLVVDLRLVDARPAGTRPDPRS